jgi:hypothetical protein
MQRRRLLQVTGAALATTVGSGYVVADGTSGSTQEGDGPIEFEDSRGLLLDQSSLPEDGWTAADTGAGDVLDASVAYQRRAGSEGDRWVVVSSAAGRDTEDAATDRYRELAASFQDRVGEARTMDLDLASEAVIAGYDGYTTAIFRDVNCVGAVRFTDCTGSGGCLSHVSRCERLARTQRRSWRGDGEDAGGGGAESEPATTENEGSDTGNVDEAEGQVSLAYGETATMSNGVETTVSEGTLYDQLGDRAPEERDRFLVVPVESVNTSDDPRTIPDQTHSWEVRFGDRQVGNSFDSLALDAEGYQAFEGGDVQGGVRRDGVLLFEVDEGYAADEVNVLWQDEFLVAADLDGVVDVRWSADA